MSHAKPIKSALISVYHKDDLASIVKALDRLGITIYSTGGTQKFIEEAGIAVTPVETLTDYPSILGGRVKTLHPKVFGGILARRDEAGDIAQLEQYNIPQIDLVIVDLYPFEATVAEGAGEQEIIEKIDIGGISLIRATAKNYRDTLIIASRDQYNALLHLLEEKQGATELEDRKKFALQAFNISSHYDTAIFNYFNRDGAERVFKKSSLQATELRYGENPHQQGIFYGDPEAMFEQLHGKALSYNNLVDIDAAVGLMAEFEEPTFAILKHTNACGVASRESLLQAWQDALSGDPVSAFGGILICNRSLDADTAEAVHQLFFEVIIAPEYESGALEVLQQKKNRIILHQKTFELPEKIHKTILNGVIEQDYDAKTEMHDDLHTATEKGPTAAEVDDLLFANKIAKHIKSNTIVLAKDKQLLGMGSGQTSRVDALRQAIAKAKGFEFDLSGAVMASDAFFPFADCVEIAHREGITAVIQPGRSIRDTDSIDYCNQHGLSMVFTGTRHFKH